MNKITAVEGHPVVTAGGRTFLYAEHCGIRFMVQDETAFRRTKRAINLLCRTGYDEMVRRSNMLTVVCSAPKNNAGALLSLGNAKIFFIDFGPTTTYTLRSLASCFVHEAQHCTQRHKYGDALTPLSRFRREWGACRAQKQFLKLAGGEKEIRYLDSLFQKKQYWWIRTKREQAAWDKWIARNNLVFNGLCDLGIVSI